MRTRPYIQILKTINKMKGLERMLGETRRRGRENRGYCTAFLFPINVFFWSSNAILDAIMHAAITEPITVIGILCGLKSSAPISSPICFINRLRSGKTAFSSCLVYFRKVHYRFSSWANRFQNCV